MTQFRLLLRCFLTELTILFHRYLPLYYLPLLVINYCKICFLCADGNLITKDLIAISLKM